MAYIAWTSRAGAADGAHCQREYTVDQGSREARHGNSRRIPIQQQNFFDPGPPDANRYVTTFDPIMSVNPDIPAWITVKMVVSTSCSVENSFETQILDTSGCHITTYCL